MKPVIAVIGDVLDSRNLPRRAEFQRRLAGALKGTTGPTLASPYTITLGDEFQAVYRSAQGLARDLIHVLAAIHPVRARFAIGVGEITTRINSAQALGMDGPAFHRAREAITQLKEQGGHFQIQAGPDTGPWELANQALALVSHRLGGWNQIRLRVLLGLLEGKPVRELERSLRISRVAIYKNINAAALDRVTALWQELERTLDAAVQRK